MSGKGYVSSNANKFFLDEIISYSHNGEMEVEPICTIKEKPYKTLTCNTMGEQVVYIFNVPRIYTGCVNMWGAIQMYCELAGASKRVGALRPT